MSTKLLKQNKNIDSTYQQLKHQLNDNEYTKINEAIGINQSIRERELKQRKNKKFYGLKFKRDPKNRYDNLANTNPPWSQNLDDASRHGRTSDRNHAEFRTNRYNNTVWDGTSYANSVRNKPPYQHLTNTTSIIENKHYSRDQYQIQRRTSQRHLNQAINVPLNTRKTWNNEELPIHDLFLFLVILFTLFSRKDNFNFNFNFNFMKKYLYNERIHKEKSHKKNRAHPE